MAELLVRTVDKVNPESIYKDSKCTKRGDVIVICPDGHPWSTVEQTNPDWTIIKFPGIPEENLSMFLAPEPGDPLVNKVLQRRQFTLDLDTLNTLPSRPTLGAILSKQISKPPLIDPQR